MSLLFFLRNASLIVQLLFTFFFEKYIHGPSINGQNKKYEKQLSWMLRRKNRKKDAVKK